MKIRQHTSFLIGCTCFLIGLVVGARYSSIHVANGYLDSADLAVKVTSTPEKPDSTWDFRASFSTTAESALVNAKVVFPQQIHMYTVSGVEAQQEETGVSIHLPNYKLTDCIAITHLTEANVDLSRPVHWDDRRDVWVLDLLTKSYLLSPDQNYSVVMFYPGTALTLPESELRLVKDKLAMSAASNPILLRTPPRP